MFQSWQTMAWAARPKEFCTSSMQSQLAASLLVFAAHLRSFVRLPYKACLYFIFQFIHLEDCLCSFLNGVGGGKVEGCLFSFDSLYLMLCTISFYPFWLWCFQGISHHLHIIIDFAVSIAPWFIILICLPLATYKHIRAHLHETDKRLVALWMCEDNIFLFSLYGGLMAYFIITHISFTFIFIRSNTYPEYTHTHTHRRYHLHWAPHSISSTRCII